MPISSLSRLSCLLVCLATVWLAPAADAEQTQPRVDLSQVLAPDAPELVYGGRWDLTDPAAPRCAWSGTAVSLRFVGTAIALHFQQDPTVHWQVFVDGEDRGQLPQGDGGVVVAASGLAPGEHSLQVMRRSEAFFGTATLRGIHLPPDARVLPARQPQRRLHVIGDSISCGYGNEAANPAESFSAGTENGAAAYGAVVARRFGAAYDCAAWSGKCLWPDNSLLDVYDRVLPVHDDSPRRTPVPAAAIVINLGTNDFGGGDPEEDGWVAAYLGFLQRLRGEHPQAQIYCALGPMLGDPAKSTCRRYLERIVREADDPRIAVLEFPQQDGAHGFGSDWHPSRGQHLAMAEVLATALQRDLDWKPVDPASPR